MADNYLERKMDEYRSRGAAVKPSAVRRKGILTFNFPERRVLVLGGNSQAGRNLVKEFAEAGCRVAVVDNGATDANMSARYYDVDLADRTAVADAVGRLLEAWTDVDVVIAVDTLVYEEIFVVISEARRRLPYRNSYCGRLVVIGDSEVSDEARHAGFTVNRVIADSSCCMRREVVRLCMFFCVPENDFINGAVIEAGGSKKV